MDARLSGDMQRALARIPERQRAALLLAELHDLTGLELAAALGVSHVAARALLTRARESLRQALAAERAAEAAAEAERDAGSSPSRGAAPMSRVPRLGAADHWAAPHERARALAAERLDAPLAARGGAWLEEHLAGCDACRRVAAAYDADRLALRAMRDRQPEPPRDLWARTAAAIEQRVIGTWRCEPARDRSSRGASRARRPVAAWRSIAVVIGATVLSGGFARHRPPRSSPPASPPAVAIASTPATPVPRRSRSRPPDRSAGSARRPTAPWPTTSPRSTRSVRRRAGRLPDGLGRRLPPGRHLDPAQVDLEVAGQRARRSSSATDATGDDAVFVIALPTADADAEADADAHADADPGIDAPTDRHRRADAERRTAASPTPTPPTPRPRRPRRPSRRQPDRRADARADPGADADATAPTPTSAIPTTSRSSSGVKVVGESAAFSPDGAWFAFTARPSDGRGGPDIYVWRVGDDAARQLTDDHAQRLRLVGRRPGRRQPAVGDRPAGDASTSPTFYARSRERQRDPPSRPAGWRPVVDPAGRWAVVWDGTVERRPDDGTPTAGRGPARPPRRSRRRPAGIDADAGAMLDRGRGGRGLRRPLGRDRHVARGLGRRRAAIRRSAG